MIRVSTANFYAMAANTMDQNQAALDKTQQQLSSGLQYQTPADNPGQAANINALQTLQSQLGQYLKNIQTAGGQLSSVETTLSSITTSVQSIRTLMVQAGDGTLTQANRQAIATQMTQQMNTLVGLMNSKNTLGQYMFGGSQNASPPYATGANGMYTYQGDQVPSISQLSDQVQVPTTLNGAAIFDTVPAVNKTFVTTASTNNTGNPAGVISAGSVTDQTTFDANYPSNYKIVFNATSASSPPGLQNFSVYNADTGHPVLQNVTYGAGASISFNGLSVSISGNPAVGDAFLVNSSPDQSLLTTVQNAIQGLNSLSNSSSDSSQLSTLISSTLGNLDQAVSSISEAQAQVGAAQNSTSAMQSVNSAVTLSVTGTLSNLTSVDYAKASSQLSLQQTVLQAAQESFVRIAGLDLFTYMGTTGG